MSQTAAQLLETARSITRQSGEFRERAIDVTFKLGPNIELNQGSTPAAPGTPGMAPPAAKPTFADGKSNQVSVSGLRCAALVDYAGEKNGQLNLRMYGMTPSLTNSIVAFGKIKNINQVNKASVLVEAGDDTGKSVVFSGTLIHAWADYQGAPNVAVNVLANMGMVEQLRPVKPLSFKGGADVVDVMTQIAQSMGLRLENSGVTGKLDNPYLPGTAMAQAEDVQKTLKFEMTLDKVKGVLAIWPKGGGRNGLIPLISQDTGLIGYPIWNPAVVIFRTIYNPSIIMGGFVQVQSDISNANGKWKVGQIRHILESETPGGQWMSEVHADLFTPVAQ